MGQLRPNAKCSIATFAPNKTGFPVWIYKKPKNSLRGKRQNERRHVPKRLKRIRRKRIQTKVKRTRKKY